MSILIAGGGTGGHLYPGIAVARELMAQAPDAEVAFVGTSGGIEARVIPREGFALDLVRSAGLKGKSLPSLVRGLALLPLSAVDGWRVITRRRPSVVVGVGGYSSGPVVLLAATRGIPTLLMEQNAMPGLTNRLLAPVVDAAAVTFQETMRFFGSKAFLSGNPVRPEFLRREEAHGQDVRPPGAARVLVFGGSQGAHAINMAVVEAAPRLAAAQPRLAITHQTGERDLEMVRDRYRRAGLEARVEPFLFAMEREMKSADLVVCRAGATTVAELTAVGRASILVPLPTATDDHQRRNAAALVEGGAALMIEQRELTGDRLAAEMLSLAADAERRRRMAEAARRLARPDAARTIVERVLALAGR
ncbi:MAG: undecaprenyldiphospho-muramoylpentapeptide beta-N-acetylglucosaminyltransferase [Acidobacteria bacterium RIFCSPLOWO2_02_FULL_68_18]|nr:MAG: undecaprenyldiphospho-muramoylpentapeptide beta-N-acetylglucosaminyltransferase [Acidobacteria bacterium RIFCSPLOWO2_02_FULL_68_18]OFW48558.1 MAG: undecaprenyldiphospho-muramoylpentapeptide beta-N-acetylglucosaminyltransferase [Acidobacteria bacterium RIFCSPLOWO2_12_FULL_68_19]